MTAITTDRAGLEELLGEYWEIAFEESSGVAATGNKANRVLHEIRALFDVKQAEIARLKAESEERLQNCAALVAEIARLRAAPATAPEFPADLAQMIHYPECWDTAAYPELRDAIHEALAWSGCSVCKPSTAPERKPMTDKEIAGEIVRSPDPMAFGKLPAEGWRPMVRLVEAFHGIKGGQAMTTREAFEEWYEVDCYPCEHSNWFRLDSDGDYEFDEVQYAWRTWQAATDAALKIVIQVCEAIENDKWALYKGRPPYTGAEPGRADNYVQGESGGAGSCASAIRALKDADKC